jgi:hypothetical protein
VTIFTFGVLLLEAKRPDWWLWLISLAWTAIGGSGAFLISVPQDLLLAITGVVSLLFWYVPGLPHGERLVAQDKSGAAARAGSRE